MSQPYLVLGATGRIGSLVVRELSDRGLPVAGLVRDAQRAAPMWPSAVVPVIGEFDAPASIVSAMQGVGVAFISSPVHPEMAAWQCQAVRAAADAGVRRIVKLSGSAWTMVDGRMTTVGAAHAQVEAAMRAVQESGGPECICIRPNAFLQGILGRIGTELSAGDIFSLGIGPARVAFADIRDIAAACAHAMAASSTPSTIEVTGPEAMDGVKIAALLTQMLGKPIHYKPLEIHEAMARAKASGADDFTLRHQTEVLTVLREGVGERVSTDFESVLGRSPRTVQDYLAEVTSKVGGAR
ncbi:NAD(P)H-binding protein [Ottowia thiooxydans]|uniref:NmrA family NAD(P)-binding protein n=1 Tax=Ottowia thiooxydans TaxID=219182 RepID=UPI000413C19E|nr:NAD(P)H-binding protein [Ottowia thiooxydans]